MKHWIKAVTAVIVFTGAILAAQGVQAGCGIPDNVRGMKPMVYRADGRAGFVKTQFFPGGPFAPFNSAGITGLWKFTFVAKTSSLPVVPAGALFDNGFITWHDDGTELTNSGRAPDTGNFCQGIWRQTGPYTYEINHWALGWAATTDGSGAVTGFSFSGPVNIQEWITLDRDGNTYSGTFKVTLYNPGVPKSANPLITPPDPSNPNNPSVPAPATGSQYDFDTSGGVFLAVTGYVAGQRVTWQGFPSSDSAL